LQIGFILLFYYSSLAFTLTFGGVAQWPISHTCTVVREL